MLKRYYHRNQQVTGIQKPVGDDKGLCQHTDKTGSEQKNDNLYRKSQQRIDDTIREPEVEVDVKQVAAIAWAIEDNDVEEDKDATIKDVELLPLYSVQQKETVDDVNINPDLSKQQTAEIKQLLTEYRQIFSDVPTVTHP